MKITNSKKATKTSRKLVTPTTPPKFKKILATTDFSSQSLPGVRYALNLQSQFGSALTLLHVVETASRLSGLEAVVLAKADSEVAARARAELAKLARKEAGAGGKVAGMIRTGKAFNEITAAASENGTDLIIIATHGYLGIKRVLLGSTTEQVVRHAPCPVLTIPTGSAPKPTDKKTFQIKKLLVPIDFSDLSKAALPWAASLATQFNAELVLLHVEEIFPIDYLLGRELMSHTMVPLMKQAKAELKDLAKGLCKTTSANISAVVRAGKPFEEICHAAKELAADMIVLTTHGHTGLKHVWLGSTAERVVRHAHCPVLVAR
jgi:nucleotide-binding universal stress UspA family protein